MSPSGQVNLQKTTVARKSFVVQSGLADIRDLGRFTEQDLLELTQQYSQAATAAMVDLLATIAMLDLRLKRQSATIQELTKDKEKA